MRFIYVFLIVLLGVIISCKSQYSNKHSVIYYNIINDYLDEYSDKIISDGTIITDDLQLTPNLSEINIYIDEVLKPKEADYISYSIYGSVGRLYNDKYLPHKYKVIKYKGNRINVFYSFIDTEKKGKFKIEYSKEYDLYFGLNDHPISWVFLKCLHSDKTEIYKTPTFYNQNGLQRIKEVDNYECM